MVSVLGRLCAQAYVSPEAAVLTRLFVKLLADDLNAVAYDAELAGLSYSVLNTKQGFLASFYGCAAPAFQAHLRIYSRIKAFSHDPG